MPGAARARLVKSGSQEFHLGFSFEWQEFKYLSCYLLPGVRINRKLGQKGKCDRHPKWQL